MTTFHETLHGYSATNNARHKPGRRISGLLSNARLSSSNHSTAPATRREISPIACAAEAAMAGHWRLCRSETRRFLGICVATTRARSSGSNGDANFLAELTFGRRLVRLLDSQCDAINLIAPAMAGELRGIGFSGRNFTEIPNGVAVRDALVCSQVRKHRILAVGRATCQKDYDIIGNRLDGPAS